MRDSAMVAFSHSPGPDLLRTEGPGETLLEDVRVQLLEEGDAPLVPGLGPRPPVHHHHAPGEDPTQFDTIVTRDMSDEDSHDWSPGGQRGGSLDTLGVETGQHGQLVTQDPVLPPGPVALKPDLDTMVD